MDIQENYGDITDIHNHHHHITKDLQEIHLKMTNHVDPLTTYNSCSLLFCRCRTYDADPNTQSEIYGCHPIHHWPPWLHSKPIHGIKPIHDTFQKPKNIYKNILTCIDVHSVYHQFLFILSGKRLEFAEAKIIGIFARELMDIFCIHEGHFLWSGDPGKLMVILTNDIR